MEKEFKELLDEVLAERQGVINGLYDFDAGRITAAELLDIERQGTAGNTKTK